MPDTFASWLAVACFAVAALGCVYALTAAALARRLMPSGRPDLAAAPGVTILKPLHGAEAGLYDNLASFCDQDYPGPVQLLFGVESPGDAAVAVVNRLVLAHPGGDLQLCVSNGARGPNPKVANLIGMQANIRGGLVVIADSDIAVSRDYLARTVAALDRPGVGAVTYLYRGEARGGLWARLSAMAIDYHFLPGVLVGLALGLARPCFGSTIALRRETLTAIGGFDAFLGQLADDNAIGAAVRATGMSVAIPHSVVAHTCTERNAGELLRHELRWARTLRAASPAGYAGLFVTHPLPFAIIGAALAGFSAPGAAIIVAAIACRLVLQVQVDHTLGVRSKSGWLGPARDLLAFAVYVASFFVDAVSWRGHRYKVRADGTLVPLGEPKT
ncbi:MAG TPA: bacteriohopanetetrol glucosamine biosynthesis glycosyltransferase HpnI [Casimicrobiaceae bacterium]|jgi:ceramide glucosyltransferase